MLRAKTYSRTVLKAQTYSSAAGCPDLFCQQRRASTLTLPDRWDGDLYFRVSFHCHRMADPPLWVWGRDLAPRVSSIASTQLQRRRATSSHPKNAKKSHEMFIKQLRPGINTSLSTAHLCLPSTAWQGNFICYYVFSQFGPRNETEYSLLFIFLCLDVWLCLKMAPENMVLVRLLQRGAKDLTVQHTCLKLKKIFSGPI